MSEGGREGGREGGEGRGGRGGEGGRGGRREEREHLNHASSLFLHVTYGLYPLVGALLIESCSSLMQSRPSNSELLSVIVPSPRDPSLP